MDWLPKVMEWAEPIATIIGYLSVLATAVLRLPGLGPSEKVDGIVVWIQKAMAWLPTIGVNPRTKALEEAMKEIKA